jgi:Sulfotransferase family
MTTARANVNERARLMSGEDKQKVDFLVVGSPRSGTTLVQRLACEIPGVVMPSETHFFPTVMGELVRSEDFPLGEAKLRRLVEGYLAVPANTGLNVDIESLVSTLGGQCRSPMQLFGAIVAQLAGSAEVRGEKTPGHIRWWRPISRADPSVRFIVVLRDPRAVVSSNLAAHWSKQSWTEQWGENKHLLFAYRWLRDEALAWHLSRTLEERAMVLRYEDVVARPELSRQRIATFLGRPEPSSRVAAPSSIIQPWESWKQQALGPISADRASAWREDGYLSGSAAADVGALCWVGAARRRYRLDPPQVTAKAVLRLGRNRHRLRGMRGSEIGEQRKLDAYVL